MLFKGIEAAGVLSPRDYGRLLYDGFTSIEPAAPLAINELFGIHLLGRSQTVLSIAILGLALLAIAGLTGTFRLNHALLVLTTALLILYVPTFHYLLNQLDASIKHSCLRFDLTEECASCYGADFGALSRALREKVPRYSKVHFVRQVVDSHKTEANFEEFVFRTEYSPGGFGEADYYVGLKWARIYDDAAHKLSDPFSGRSVDVEPVYRLSDSFILKAKR